MFLQEISIILLQILFVYVIFRFQIISENSKILKNFSSNFTRSDLIGLNIIIFLNLFIIFSILSVNINFFFYSYLVLIFIVFLIDKKYRNKITYNNEFLFLFIILILSIDLASELILGWDVQNFWYFKALNLFQEKNFGNLNVLPFAGYPHLGPYIWGFFWKFPFGNFEYLGRISYIFLYTYAIFSFSEVLKIKNIARLIFSLLVILASYKYELFNGDPDILIFIFLLFAAKLTFYLNDIKMKKNQLFLMLQLLGIANILYWTKMEGIFFVTFLIISILIYNNFIHKKIKIKILCMLFFIIIFKPIYFELFNITQYEKNLYQFNDTFDFNFGDFLDRSFKIFFYLCVYIIENSLYVISALLFILMKKNALKSQLNKTIYSFSIMSLIFIYAAFFFKSIEVELQLRQALPQMIFGLSSFYLLFISSYINQYSAGRNNLS